MKNRSFNFQFIFISRSPVSNKTQVPNLKIFELTIPKQYIDHINKEIKKPKRPHTELLELWLERELSIENEGTYGNLPTDESHVTVKVLPNGNYKVIISEVCFSMIASHVQPEPHGHKMHNEDVLHCWLDLKTNKLHAEEHILVKETA
jgi:hypothetical protein